MLNPRQTHPHGANGGERGQVLAIGALLFVALIAMGALLLEGGNAFAQQRITQNGSDSAANAGALVLAQRLGGATKSDTDVLNAVTAMTSTNSLTAFAAHYTDVKGKAIDVNGAPTSSSGNPAAAVGGGVIPPSAQGVAVGGTRTFGTVLARALGINSFDASADATAVTGRLVGGAFLPVIFPVSISDCSGNGSLVWTQTQWQKSQPPNGSPYPTGTEYIVPLCKTGSGSFQILDLDPTLTCREEAANPPFIEWTTFPVDVPVDNGNNCAKPIADEVNLNLLLKPVMIPICDVNCYTGSGSNGVYHIKGVAAFYIDYMSDSNNKNNGACLGGTSPTSGQTLTNVIGGNGSSSCVVGWFIDFITAGPVGTGSLSNGEAIGVQLIR